MPTSQVLNKMKQTLRIHDFESQVHLGLGADEQESKQPVQFTLEIFFLDPVAAAESDEILETLDYVELTQIISAVSAHKQYHLIEHLNQQVMFDLMQYLKAKRIKGKISLTVKKLRVPIENLRSGVSFTCEIEL